MMCWSALRLEHVIQKVKSKLNKGFGSFPRLNKPISISQCVQKILRNIQALKYCRMNLLLFLQKVFRFTYK